MADEASDLRLQERGELRFDPGQRRANASSQDTDRRRSKAPMVAGEMASAAPGARRLRTSGRRRRAPAAETGRPARTRRTPSSRGRGRAPRRIARRRRSPPRRRPRALERPQAADQQAEEGDVPITLGGQSRHALDHPRRLRSRSRSSRTRSKGRVDVEVVDANQLAASIVEEDQFAERAKLERPLPNLDRIRRAAFATPRILPKSRSRT